MSVEDHRAKPIPIDRFLTEHPLPLGEPHVCPYLPDRVARNEGFQIGELSVATYRALLDRGFRRSGQLIYRPACETCRACQQLRVPVDEFALTRSQRRVRRKNADVRVTPTSDPKPTDAKWRIFEAYLNHQHDGRMIGNYDQFIDFLYTSPVPAIEFTYWAARRIVGVSIADRCQDGLSSVYMFFDPDQRRRSLGTFSVICETEFCRDNGIPYYYLGYYVAGAGTMAYKGRFRPHEILDDTGAWRRVDG